MMDWVKLLRLKHWIKNLLVLFPILFAKEAFDLDLLLTAIAGFFAFCFASSAIYIINDIKDVEHDRLHPEKRKRPIASGAVDRRIAGAVSAILIVVSILITLLIAERMVAALACIASYITLNLLYSWHYKSVPVVDIAILAVGFVLRIFYGGAICDILISAWLFLTTLTLAVYLGLGKRLGELTTHGADSRESLKSYSQDFLKSNLTIFMVCGLVFYSLWTISRSDSLEIGANASSSLLILSVPLVMFILLRYNYVIDAKDREADPVEVVTKDWLLLMLIAAWIAMMIVALYC